MLRRAVFLLGILSISVLFHAFLKETFPLIPIYEPNRWTYQRAHPVDRTTPACTIWPDWRPTIPQPRTPDDHGLAAARVGTAEVMGGYPEAGCVPASERLGPFNHSSRSVDNESDDRPWTSLHWGQLQSDCVLSYFDAIESTTTSRRLKHPPVDVDYQLNNPRLENRSTGRTAVVLRTWGHYQYSDNQMAWMRAITMELALDTGGAFQMFLLVDVKDPNIDDLNDESTYAATLADSVPSEFRDLALLFNEHLLREWYPLVSEHDAQDQMYQALQIFSFSFPEFDNVWQLEMDARVTGNIATMLSNTALWATRQPRKNLWERNARWYVPELWEDGYTSFAEQVDLDFAHDPHRTIWGPPPNASRFLTPQGPTPPRRTHTSWGVGESPDLITFAPLIDPVGTRWLYEGHVFGVNDPAPLELPRRMAIISMTRTSRRLLRLISAEQRRTGMWVVSESTPETWALLHGLKAVYAPHVVVFDVEAEEYSVTPWQLNEILNHGPTEGRAGGNQTSFLYCGFDVMLPERRWFNATYFYWAGEAPSAWRDYTSGTCTYPLLLHPVKNG